MPFIPPTNPNTAPTPHNTQHRSLVSEGAWNLISHTAE